MSSTLSTPDPAQQVREVREIIVHRGDHSCEATLLAIRRVVMPPPPDEPTWFDTGSGPGYGTVWERHDDPEQQL